MNTILQKGKYENALHFAVRDEPSMIMRAGGGGGALHSHKFITFENGMKRKLWAAYRPVDKGKKRKIKCLSDTPPPQSLMVHPLSVLQSIV